MTKREIKWFFGDQEKWDRWSHLRYNMQAYRYGTKHSLLKKQFPEKAVFDFKSINLN